MSVVHSRAVPRRSRCPSSDLPRSRSAAPSVTCLRRAPRGRLATVRPCRGPPPWPARATGTHPPRTGR